MRVRSSNRRQGIALIIVMIVITILATLAAGLAYSMKVETRLARNASFEPEMELLGRSGVELARYILAMQLRIPGQGQYTALNQKWANGPATTNELLIDIHLEDNVVGAGRFSIRIKDLERKYNLTMIREGQTDVLQRALALIGVDPSDVSTIVDSYLDWIDPDDANHVRGAESNEYLHLNPANPYAAKNGLMDDITEFLMVKGITPEIFWGSGRTGVPIGWSASNRPRGGSAYMQSSQPQAESSVGLVDLFTTISGAGAAVNINTASAEVLQLLPGMDPSLARAIVDTRAGPDHADGTEDDTPFEQRGDLGAIPGIDTGIINIIGRYMTLQSFLFQVEIDAQIGDYHKNYVALLHRRNAQDVGILYFHPF